MQKLKSLGIALTILIVIVVVVGGIKYRQIYALTQSGEAFKQPPETVNVATVTQQSWPITYSEIGTVEAEQGINVVAEVPGKIIKIFVESGAEVEAGHVVLEQESSNEEAQLRAANARLRLAKANYERVVSLLEKKSVSRSELDSAVQQVDSVQGDVDDLQATLAKKVIRVPFSGRLGIVQVDPGQVLQPGDAIVSLQAIEQVKVKFPVPQEWLPKIKTGMEVQVVRPGTETERLTGKISALESELNLNTRNIIVEAMFANKSKALIPGMAVRVEVVISEPDQVLVVPSTAIIYAPFGDTVFTVHENDQGQLEVKQRFVQLGRSLGDFVQIAKGLEVGEQIVTTGAFKLFNGQAILVSDTPPPDYQQHPKPGDN